MIRLKFIVFFSLVFSVPSVNAQQILIDSLINQAYIESEGGDLDISKLSAWQKVFSSVKDSKSDYRVVEICTNMGDLFFDHKIYDSAINYYKYVFSTDIDTVQKSEDLINLYRRIGQSYSNLNKPDSALIYYEQIFDEFNFPDRIDVYRDLVDIYGSNNDFQKSLEYNLLIKDLLIENKASVGELTKVFNNIGFDYHQLKNYKNAIKLFEAALKVNPLISQNEKSSILGNLGICYFNLGDYDQSIDLLQRAYDSSSDIVHRAELAHLIASVYMTNSDYLRAIKYYKLSEGHAETAKMDGTLVDVYAGLASVYNRTHEYDLAFEYYKRHSSIRDSLKFVEELNRKRLLDNQKYIERAEKENSLLKAQQDFQLLQIEQLETEARNQKLRTEALKADSIRAANELSIARQRNELSAITEANNELEIARQKNLIKLTNQQLAIARSNEENAIIESEKQLKEIELAQEKLNLQERDAQLKSEQEANEKKALELEKGKVQQRNTLLLTLLLGLLAIFVAWAYRNKKKDNDRLSVAYDEIRKSQNLLQAAEAKIRKLLKQQVSGAVANALITDSSFASDEQKFVCIMFLDIRNFTVFCEGRKPSEIIAYQNSVFGFMINIIEKHHGVVNQLVGDGFMATFGAPVSKGNDCLNAYMAAKKIMNKLASKVSKNKIYPTKVGIGLHAGYVVTGNVGNKKRKQFSITGNTVILAARLEQLNKQFGSTLVFSKELYDQLPDDAREDIPFQSVMVKGRSQPIEVAAI